MNRRDLMKGSALAIGAATACVFSERAGAADARIVVEEHWAKKGNVDLYLYRKRVPGPGSQPVLVLVHGSSFSGRGGFDLQVPGHPRYSLMDEFARYGFDVWTMDHEGYGRSTRTGSNSDILSGAEDLRAALPVIEQVTGKPSVMMFGQSSGAIRAGAFTAGQPDKIERLVLDAFTHTGENAPEIMRRRARVDTYRANPSRPIDRSTFIGIFSRDDPSTFEPAVPEALAKFELAMGDRVPSGTYLDMAVNLPLVDPAKISCPVLMLRAEHDGNATDEELLNFFAALPNRDKQFVFMSGVAHVAVLGTNRHRLWHVMREFLTYPLGRAA
jgi:pimeloyl-ACP methyl ester carboxylesterase